MSRRTLVAVTGLVFGAMLAGSLYGQTASPTQSERRSLLPDWFGRRSEQPAAKAAPAEGPARTAATWRRGSAQSTPALPGLGGSPLPQGDWSPAGGDAVRQPSSTETPSDYPVIREESPRQSASGTSGTASTAPTQRTAPTVRQSPGARSVPHVNPDQIRRELSGTFSQPKSTSQPRTARLEPSAVATDDDTTADEAEGSSPSLNEATPTDAPQSLPVIEQSPWISAERPTDAPQTEPTPTSERYGSSEESTPSANAANVVRPPSVETPAATPSTRGKEAFGEALQIASGGDPSVLAANQTPVITTDIRGPKQILVGREAVYRVRVQNQGSAAAEGIVVSVRIPSWAEVVNSTATQGTVRPIDSNATTPQVDWQVARLEGRGSETLDIRLVPRQSRPLELGVSWTLAAVASKAIVEVQEAKLQIDVAGPNEVLFEKAQVFRLTISNPGTGAAEKVNIQLVPPGGGPASSHELGDLAPGDSKTVEVELTAREAGKLMISASASAEGGLTCDASKEVFCRKPELEIEWRGPATKYAGTAGTYFFRVRNPGTAPAEDVTVKVALPENVEFTAGSDGQSFDPKRREVAWQVGTLGPGDDKYMELKCVLNAAGANQFAVTAATAAGDLTDSDKAETNVVALADLKLEVSDPSGPVAVGTATVYDIRVQNRGSSAAKGVSIVGLFSEGIEPDQAEGAQYTVTDGRVSFHTIDDLPAGRDITLKIRAHAVKPGTHVFRAEVLCSDAEIKLAAEETTRFYTDEVLTDSSAQASAQ